MNELHYFNLDDLDFKEVLGQGKFLLFKGTKAGKNVAVKRVECEKNAIPREVEVHSSLPSHPNILPFLGVTHSRDGFSVYVCLELADKSLRHFLHTEKKKPSLKQSTNWAMQIAKGMQHLHEHGVIHRDVKSACVLLFQEKSIIKIGGFGSALALDHTTTVSQPNAAFSPLWRAPELLDGAERQINQRCDVFSYGMVLYEIFTQKLPFYGYNKQRAVESIRSGKRPPIPPEAPLYIQQVMKFCWKHNPHDRPTFEGIIQVGYSD